MIARIGPISGEKQDVVLHVDDVMVHLSTDVHDWQRIPYILRVEEMGLCFAGLVNSPWLEGVREAFDLIGMEGLIEQFGGLPSPGGWLDQTYGYVQAFSEIRYTRNLIDERNIKAQQANAKR